MKKLKPCPFCGTEPIILSQDTGRDENAYVVTCNNAECETDVRTAHFYEVEQAVKAWNKRAKMEKDDE